jgi:hypothetical protein
LIEMRGGVEVAMLRRADGFALLGIALLIAGVVLYFTGSSHRISLVYWLGGPLLWFTGFTIVIGSLAARLLPKLKNTSPPSAHGGSINQEHLNSNAARKEG